MGFEWFVGRTVGRGSPSLTGPHWTCMCLCAALMLGYCTNQVSSYNNLRHRSREIEHDMPYFKQTPKNITVHPGNRAILRCKVENLGTKTVSWRKDGEINPLTIGFFTFTPDTRINLDFNQRDREWSLTIQAVRPEDEGTYNCQVTTKANSELYYSIQLNVLTVQITGVDYVEVNKKLRLMCNATGKPNPPHNVDWLKDGKPLQSSAKDGVLITKKIETKVLVSVLVITKVQLSDHGVYTCRSSNNDEAEFKLNVLDTVFDGSIGKKARDGNGRNGQQISPYKEVRGTASSWIHRNSHCMLVATCLTVGLLFQDTRWWL